MPQAHSSDVGTGTKSSRRRSFPTRALMVVGFLGLMYIVSRVFFASFSVPSGAMENTIMAGDYVLVDKTERAAVRGTIIVFDLPGYREQVRLDEPQAYMKRCVAIAGDTLEVRDNVIHINGIAQPAPPDAILSSSPVDPGDRLRTFPVGAGYTRDNWGPMRVPKKGDVLPLNDTTYDRWRIFMEREGHQVEWGARGIMVDGRPASQYVVGRDYCFGMGDNRDNSLDSRYWGFIPVESIIGTPWCIYWSHAPEFSPEGGEVRWDRIFKTVE